MSLINYKYYIKQVIEFSRSIVIKNSTAAVEFNNWLKLQNYEVLDDPKTWKYYLNLAGIRHESDSVIMVSSFDTKELIEFSVESLKLHPSTKLHYQTHTPQYKALIAKYPTQEIYIRGVLNPVDLDTSINSSDNTILTYDSTYIEPQESNLISKLQTRVDNYSYRWNVPAFHGIDDLYLAGHLGILYLNIPNWILAIRLENLKSRFTHSFHVREYLRSHGYLDRFFIYLTTEQKLFLYRNIQYIERNGGQQRVFEWLHENILGRRGLGLAEYNLANNLESIETLGHGTNEFIRNPLNKFHLSTKSEVFDLETLLEKQRSLTRSNFRVEADLIKEQGYILDNPNNNKYKSKVLESSTLDFSDSGVTIFTEELLKYWLVWSTTGRYDTTFKFINPKTNKQIIINAKEAFILFLYVYNKANGITLTQLPKLRANMVRNDNTLDFSALESMANPLFLKGNAKEFLTSNRLLNTPIPFNYTFVDRVHVINNEFKALRELYSLNEYHRGRGQLQSCSDRLYASLDIDLEVSSYSEWLSSRNIDIEDIDPVEYTSFYKYIVRVSTGIDFLSTITVRGIQKAMIGIMEQLSSYNVQYLKEVNENPIVIWDRLSIRGDKTELKSIHDIRVDTLTKIISDVKGKGKYLLKLPAMYEYSNVDSSPSRTIVNIDINLDYKLDSKPNGRLRFEMPNVQMRLL